MNDEFLRDTFRRGLNTFEEKPDAGTWERVVKRMESRRRIRVFLTVFSAAATVLAILSYFALREPGDNNTRSNQLSHGLVDSTTVERPAKMRAPELVQSPEVSRPAPSKPIASASERASSLLLVSGDVSSFSETVQDSARNFVAKSAAQTSRDEVVFPDSTGFTTEEPVAIDSVLVKELPKLIEPAADDMKNTKIKRFHLQSITFQGGPDFAFYDFAANSDDRYYLLNMDQPESLSSDRLGWRFNVGAEWTMGKRLSVFTGLLFSRSKYRGSFDLSSFQGGNVEYDHGTNILVLTPEEQTGSIIFRQRSSAIGGTMNVSYLIRSGKTLHRIGAGFNAMLINENLFALSAHESEGRAVSMNVFYTVEYRLNRKLFIFARPLATIEVERKNTVPSMIRSANSYNLGLQIGTGLDLAN